MGRFIKGTGRVFLQPKDTKVGVTVRVIPCSSATANDGFIEYGNTVVSSLVDFYKEDTLIDSSDILLAGPTVSGGEYLRVDLTYPTTNGAGDYKATFTMTLDNGATRELDLDNITAIDY